MAASANQAPPQLHGVVAKIQRAQEHFTTLNHEILAYLKDCRDSARHPITINPQQSTIRVYFQPIAEPGLQISVIVGDCVHNLRSAIDHIWKRLGQDDGNFPLYCDIDGPNNWLLQGKRRIAGLPAEAQVIIDRLQPCHLGKDAPTHPLAILNKLSNIDKHEAIHLTRPQSVNTSFAFRHKGSSRDVCVVRLPAVFHENTEVIITDVPPGIVEPGMDVSTEGTLFVSFKAEGPWKLLPVQEVLNHCIDFVRDSVLSPLAPYMRAL